MNHLMKLTLLGGLALTACNNNEFAYVATYVANPESDGETPPSCTFDPGADATVTINLDVARSSSLDLVAGVRNNLKEVDIAVDQMSTNAADRIKIPRAITPLRFDFRWECESTGFTGGIGPIILPAFSGDLTQPFCLDNRDDVTGDFVGFDVVPASGPPVDPGGTGFVKFTPVPPQLGRAFREFFEVAIQSEACCDELKLANGDCDDLSGASEAPGTACGDLQGVFDTFAGPSQLSARQVNDVQRFRPFIAYTSRSPDGGGGAYPMRLSGFFEGVLPSGELITSTQFNQEVGICSGSCVVPSNIQDCLIR